MTTKLLPTQPAARRLPPLPDPPRKGDMQESLNFELPADMNTLARHLDALDDDSTTLVAGRGYLCQSRSDLPRAPYPDMLVAFGVDAPELSLNNGYVIDEVGKPPALVLEVASSSTGKNDYIRKRGTYANLGVPEYWRFDHTGGQYHDVPLAGDRLTPEGVYQPIELHTEPDGVIWGYSEVLQLSLCWVPGPRKGRLRFWNRQEGCYLRDPSNERDGRVAAETQAAAERDARIAEREARIAAETRAAAAEAQAAAERDARIAAEAQAAEREARIRRLEQELRRRPNP